MDYAPRPALVIGRTGQLGQALSAAMGGGNSIGHDLLAVDHRALVDEVMAAEPAPVVEALMRRYPRLDWHVAVGLVSPATPAALLERINHRFPVALHVRLGTDGTQGHRIVTYGSVLEARAELAAANPYLASKRRLFQAHSGRGDGAAWLHFQLHTLYGGEAPPHRSMFTGQMFHALQAELPFEMSSGEQLREYHHVADVAESVARLTADEHAEGPVALGNGRPIRLRDLAEAVFAHFGAAHLLTIGARRHDAAEVFEIDHEESPYLAAWRDPIAGVIAWFEAHGLERKK